MALNLNPLSQEQRRKVRHAAKEGTPREELITLVGLDTGIRRSAIAHLRPEMVHMHAAEPFIQVQPWDEIPSGADVCDIGFQRKGAPNSGDAPCHVCENSDNRPNGVWHPKTDTSIRKVYVLEDDTQQILQDFFSVHDRVGSENVVGADLERVAERAGLDRKLTPHHLRQTYGTKLAETDHTAHEIKKLMGHLNIQRSQDYVDMFGSQLRESHAQKWRENS